MGTTRVARSDQGMKHVGAFHNDRGPATPAFPRGTDTVAPAELHGQGKAERARAPLKCAISRPAGEGVMVEMRGLEPLTPSLQRRCSPS
jgi:hypothetical protein